MTTLKIPFTLEQEVRYRQYFRDVLKGEDYQKHRFPYQTGVLVNMAVYELVKFGIYDDFSFDFFEGDITQLHDETGFYIDFQLLSCHTFDWLMGKECQPYRLMIEEREEKITGVVSNSFEVIPLIRKKSKVLNQKGLDPARELTTKEAIKFFEEEMNIYADVYNLDRREFGQLAILEILISREKMRERMKMKKIKEEKPPKGFGRSSQS
jgi:hypothetical protein